MLSLLQNILLDLSMMEKGKALDFNSGNQLICSVSYDDIKPNDSEKLIPVYELSFQDDNGEMIQEILQDSDVVAMMVYTELRKHALPVN